MDVYTYFHQRERECRELSLVPDISFEEMFAEEAGSDGARGFMWGRLSLTGRAFLNVLETVIVVRSGVHRERYSYYLIIDGLEVWGYDRDPDHSPAEHMHRGEDHTAPPRGAHHVPRDRRAGLGDGVARGRVGFDLA